MVVGRAKSGSLGGAMPHSPLAPRGRIGRLCIAYHLVTSARWVLPSRHIPRALVCSLHVTSVSAVLCDLSRPFFSLSAFHAPLFLVFFIPCFRPEHIGESAADLYYWDTVPFFLSLALDSPAASFSPPPLLPGIEEPFGSHY